MVVLRIYTSVNKLAMETVDSLNKKDTMCIKLTYSPKKKARQKIELTKLTIGRGTSSKQAFSHSDLLEDILKGTWIKHTDEVK